ncbi:TonB-dependent siderophore receptor [Synechococcus sp. PCC 6312]|uniref:TonB-dependent siderophore receptor n=1 Tax=Synechococcus sp. (strain ATCC 27167 / PCC 6312) TaxID=195253 RepID=UPI00029F28A1|nr:TonB-dependent siderophore receptor [Synechococcus sp. PCC 6312]AFY59541.1 TonB-dependent siderophore receptor [Synechococcus sp. PCC 6312]
MKLMRKFPIFLLASLAIPLESASASENKPAQTVQEWLQAHEQWQAQTPIIPPNQLAQAPVGEITGVEVQPTETGIQILFTLPGGADFRVTTEQQGTTLTAIIQSAQLSLPNQTEFQQADPTATITSVQVKPGPDNTVQVIVIGKSGTPTVQFQQAEGQLVAVIGLTASPIPSPQTEQVRPTPTPDIAQDGIEIVVTADGAQGYFVPDSSSATGTDTPIRDVPFSIQVVPQQVIQDRNVTELGGALQTVPGVVPAGGRGASVFGPGFLIRGFNVDSSIFRDRIPNISLGPLNLADIERVEVLQGPASVLYGQGQPGGIINLVPKLPLSDPRYAASFTVGNFNTYQTAIDLSGPLNDAKTVKYRLNIAYDNYGSFRDFVSGEQLLISPILSWDITPDTAMNFYGQFSSTRETVDRGIVAIGNRPADLPRNRFLGEPFNEFTQSQFLLGYGLNHRFNDNVSFRHNLQYIQYQPQRYSPLPDFLDEATGKLNRIEYLAGGTYSRFFTNAEVVGKFNTGFVKHQLLFGTEYRHEAETPQFQFGDYPSINIFNPIYANLPYSVAPIFFRDDTVNTIGIYVQDQIELLSNLKLLAGVRYDYVDQFRTTRDLGAPREEFTQRDGALTPRFGIVYQPIEPVSLYASYTTSFDPSFGASLNADGSGFDPETGRQFEVGVKTDILERLSLTLALYDIRKQNVQTPDPANPIFTLQTGEVASRGFEINIGGEVLPGWNLTAGYAYVDAFVSQDNTDIVGNQLANVPPNQFTLWSTYEIQEGMAKGLGFGLGLFYVDSRYGDLENTFILPSYFRTDAALYYRRDNWRMQLNIENLFDINYFTAATFGSRLGIDPGRPFAVSGTFGIEF